MAGVPKEQLMAQLGPFLGSAISTVTQTYEKKMQVRTARLRPTCLAYYEPAMRPRSRLLTSMLQEKDAELRRARAELAEREAALTAVKEDLTAERATDARGTDAAAAADCPSGAHSQLRCTGRASPYTTPVRLLCPA